MNTRVCIDTPTEYPRSIAFHLSGWVASSSDIDSVYCGSRRLEFIDRADVIEHFKNSEYSSFFGFYGVANELEIKDSKVEIKVIYSNGATSSESIELIENNLLNISKERNFDNFEKTFANESAEDCIAKSFDLAISNDCNWKQKGIDKVVLEDVNQKPDNLPLNFLPEEIAKKFKIEENGTAASRGHDPLALALIGKFKDGLILDCGSGFPILNYRNVVNFEIQRYSNTDVIGVGQELPFKENSFDVVFSHSVLEHVTDPFLCAKEIERVLKPGGILYASVPFLIPLHGYPDHYYNMTQNGLRNLFANLNEVRCNVPNSGHPIYSVSSALEIWRNGLESDLLRKELESLTVKELINDKDLLVQKNFSQSLSQDIQKNISCTNLLIAQKEQGK